jgi:hypothetical protein
MCRKDLPFKWWFPIFDRIINTVCRAGFVGFSIIYVSMSLYLFINNWGLFYTILTSACLINRSFHSRDRWPQWGGETNSRTVHQYGRHFIVLVHQYGRRDVRWKRSIESIKYIVIYTRCTGRNLEETTRTLFTGNKNQQTITSPLCTRLIFPVTSLSETCAIY